MAADDLTTSYWPGARPINGILIKFKIQQKFGVL